LEDELITTEINNHALNKMEQLFGKTYFILLFFVPISE